MSAQGVSAQGEKEQDDLYHCITCSDEGCPLTVVAVDDERGLALCEDADGNQSSVEISLVVGAAGWAGPSTVLLVHAGTALSVLEPA